MCCKDKKNLFGRYCVGAIHESPAVKMPLNRFIELNCNGKAVECIIKQLPDKYAGLEVDNYIIMPNHIHLLLSINNNETLGAIRESPLQRSLISKVIGYLKATASKEIHKEQPTADIRQRGFYDHIIRNQKEYENAWQYIEHNALKLYPKDKVKIYDD